MDAVARDDIGFSVDSSVCSDIKDVVDNTGWMMDGCCFFGFCFLAFVVFVFVFVAVVLFIEIALGMASFFCCLQWGIDKLLLLLVVSVVVAIVTIESFVRLDGLVVVVVVDNNDDSLQEATVPVSLTTVSDLGIAFLVVTIASSLPPLDRTMVVEPLSSAVTTGIVPYSRVCNVVV